MNALGVNLEKEFEALDPEDALSIQRALVEMLALARRKQPARQAVPKSVPYTLPSWNLGVRPELDLTKLAHFDEDDVTE